MSHTVDGPADLSVAHQSAKRSPPKRAKTTYPLERKDDVGGGDGLAVGVLEIRDAVAQHLLEVHFHCGTHLIIDLDRDALYAARRARRLYVICQPP